ncbi:hypothetical protein FKW77_003734 [Venturia effusa]|uniref:Eukaryotic translation initiation factor 3 subunit J n=1 Tax=Venturia effusa TaxID=50376 RepID=A0A517LAR6_9PEZI|nr:hypothetical protein FKW77_003734 [Venturia effusa]
MAPGKWDDEESESSSSSSSPVIAATRRKFDDEEDDGDVLDSWDAAEDSEVEREKEKKAAEAKAKADAEAKANHKSKAQRIAEKQAENARRLAEESSDEEEEDEATRRRRMRETEINSDLAHAEDLFGGEVQMPNTRTVKKSVILTDSKDPMSAVDLASMPLFNPKTKEQFTKLRETLIPLIVANSKHAQYTLFMQEFTKQICKDLPSDQIKKIASGLTTLSNEKMKEEKAAEKGGKKKNTKAKTVLKADKTFSSSKMVDTMAYDDDGLDE